MPLYFHPVVSSFFFCRCVFLFLAYSQQSQIGCLPYFHTWCGLSANLECRSEMCCTRLAENKGRKNDVKKSPSAHHRTALLGYMFATKACIDNWAKKLVEQQYLPHMSSQYGELRPTSGWDRFVSLGHLSKFQRVSSLDFVTAATSLSGSQPNFARCLAVSWAGTLHFQGLLPRNGNFARCKCHFASNNSRMRSPILAALLHGTRAVGVHHVGHRPTF